MRARTIELGRDYWVRVRIAPVTRAPGGWGFPGFVGRRRATVVELVTEPGRRQATAVVESDRWVCVNADEFGTEVSRAMLEGKLRYRPGRHRWTAPVRDVLTPTQPATPAVRAEAERVVA